MMAEAEKQKIKIAVVGGGCGALSAAYELSKYQECEITVYQMGWRLGGKGASGRNKHAQAHNRTEEHGLHVWMGFYENAFKMMRRCYAELPELYAQLEKDAPSQLNVRQSPFASWDEAFFADHWVGVADESRGGWRTWSSFFPATPGLPGDPLDFETNPFSLRNYLARSCDLLRALMRSGFADSKQERTDAEDLSAVTPEKLVNKISAVVRTGVLSGASAIYEAASILKVVVGGRLGLPGDEYSIVKFAEAIGNSVREQAESLFANDADLGPKLELVELVTTVIVGLLRDQLLSEPEGLDAINDEDCKVWLARHGASARATESPLVNALYNMAFADVKANAKDRPGLAAGQALRGALRMFFTYRGSLFWKMRAGMGDVVFSPLYEVLKLRGVKFEFFHELVDVVVTPPKDDEQRGRVTELYFHRQATPKAAQQAWRDEHRKRARSALESLAIADGEYYPLDEDGCWPSAAHAALLDETHEAAGGYEEPSAKKSRNPSCLKKLDTSDFDCVVLGVSLGALESACPSLLQSDTRWRSMVDMLPTISTQALQLWLRDGMESFCSSPTPTTVAGFAKPFDTWSDMTQIIAQENWPDTERPEGLIYFCGALPYQQAERSQQGEARDAVVEYLDNALPGIWPKLREGRRVGFRWNALAGSGPVSLRPSHEEKRRLLDDQYLAFNTHPSDRYVLTRPGTMQYRISPLDSGYENLTMAGDWTDCGFNEGCVEAAVMSGLLACHAICGQPELESIVGFDHP